jgi:glycosyltransferase involved in cell wall biosynthesis
MRKRIGCGWSASLRLIREIASSTVYAEAWSFGKPVIGGNIPAVAEVIDDGVDGYLVEQEPAQIAKRICTLLLNPALAQRMGTAGQNKVNKRCTWERIARNTERTYSKALQNR